MTVALGYERMFAPRPDADGWLDDLNAEQRAAVTHPGGPLLVVAGAASVDKRPENVGELVHAGWQHGLSRSAYRFAR